MNKVRSIICIPFFICTAVFSQEYVPSLDVRFLLKPEVITIDDSPTVYYELLVTNFSQDSIILNRIAVVNSENQRSLHILDKEELMGRYHHAGSQSTDSALFLGAGNTGLIYLEYTLPDYKEARLQHQIEFERIQSGQAIKNQTQGPIIENLERTVMPLGAPLGEGNWVAIYDPSWTRGHRRYVYTKDGQARIPGRFAIDFIKVDAQGAYAAGDENEVNNWYGYGEKVISVSDGVVVALRDDFPESKTLSKHPGYTAEKATGNYVAVDIGNERIAFYEHLKPQSIQVSIGQKLKKGEIIGSVGFTGQTTGPHFHFHLSNRNSPLGAEGISFEFEKFKVIGEYPDFDTFGKEVWKPVASLNKINQRPASNTVIRFVE